MYTIQEKFDHNKNDAIKRCNQLKHQYPNKKFSVTKFLGNYYVQEGIPKKNEFIRIIYTSNLKEL